jgi:hypothetical protein
MTPREKAVELVHKFGMENQYYERAKQCALIAVDEMYWMISQMPCDKTQELNYLLDVEEEIQKL